MYIYIYIYFYFIFMNYGILLLVQGVVTARNEAGHVEVVGGTWVARKPLCAQPTVSALAPSRDRCLALAHPPWQRKGQGLGLRVEG